MLTRLLKSVWVGILGAGRFSNTHAENGGLHAEVRSAAGNTYYRGCGRAEVTLPPYATGVWEGRAHSLCTSMLQGVWESGGALPLPCQLAA